MSFFRDIQCELPESFL